MEAGRDIRRGEAGAEPQTPRPQDPEVDRDTLAQGGVRTWTKAFSEDDGGGGGGGGTHSLAPGQSSGMVGFDVGLQLAEDGEVGLHPVGVGLVSSRMEEEEDNDKQNHPGDQLRKMEATVER